MCKIIHLQPGITPTFEMIQMATWNNPHGYGLILKDKEAKKLQLIKSGKDSITNGNDPKEVYDLLREHDDLERFLHLRWKTEGDISEDNIQPFPVYHSKARDVFFMHNGTLYDYRPPSPTVSYLNGVRQETKSERSGWSDTRVFAEDFLSPLLARFKGEDGPADINDPVFQKLLNKFWGHAQHNRGILISSDQEPYYINRPNWTEKKLDNGQTFMASNDSYFTSLTRGFEFDRREKEKKEQEARFQAAEAAKAPSKTDKSPSLVRLRELLLGDQITLPLNVKELLSDINVYTPAGLAELKNITALEWEKFTESKADTLSMILHLTDEYSELFERYQKLVQYQQQQEDRKVG